MSITQWLKRRDTLLVLVIIVLFFASTIHGIIVSNAQRDIVDCNRKVIIESNNALRQRDAATVEQATSAKHADEARRKIILLLVDRALKDGAPISQRELDVLLTDYNGAVDKRMNDLDATINRARAAPIPTYACLNGD